MLWGIYSTDVNTCRMRMVDISILMLSCSETITITDDHFLELFFLPKKQFAASAAVAARFAAGLFLPPPDLSDQYRL